MNIRPTSEGKWPEVPLNVLLTVSLGNATQWNIGLFETTRGRCLVVIERKGAFNFSAPDFLHYGYVQEKLGLMNGDAMNVADFLNAQHIFNQGLKQEIKQGYYNPAFCSEREWED
jgi:hypothetical protein